MRKFLRINSHSSGLASILVVAGGGGGGKSSLGGGGGGGGGVLYNSAYTIAIGTYSITVGAGGAGGTNTHGSDGNNSVFDALTATGGGGGGDGFDAAPGAGRNGGSGGGSGGQNGQTGAGSGGGSGVSGQGFAGGDSWGAPSYVANGGGGGGSAIGGAATALAAGNGGAGVANSISGSSVTYGGGGGGGVYPGGTGTAGSGGTGGGGAGNKASSGTAGTVNTGGGGGGTGTSAGGAGGSGIVIISYPTGSMVCSGGTITTSGGNTIHTFTASGVFVRVAAATTLDSGYLGGTAILSGGNSTVSNSSGNYIVLSTTGKSTGKWYFEALLVSSASHVYNVGVANHGVDLGNPLGSEANGWGYFTAGADGYKYNSGSFVTFEPVSTDGDYIGVALDMTGGTIAFYKNGSLIGGGNAFTGLTGTLYAALSSYAGNGNSMTINFGETTFHNAPPSGYAPWG